VSRFFFRETKLSREQELILFLQQKKIKFQIISKIENEFKLFIEALSKSEWVIRFDL